tara:strand:+ start:6302 stop:7642 length:1341 start_codon:yes stop_codon:yes gene_type:complete
MEKQFFTLQSDDLSIAGRIESDYVSAVLFEPVHQLDFRVPLEAFSHARNADLVAAAMRAFEGESISRLSFGQAWEQLQLGTRFEGISIYDSTAVPARSAEEVRGWANAIRDAYVCRATREAFEDMSSALAAGNASDVVKALRCQLERVETVRVGQARPVSVSQASSQILNQLTKNCDEATGVPIGVAELDDLYLLQPGSLVVVGADTNVGKTSMLMHMSENLVRKKITVGYVSLEDSELDILGRVVGRRARVNPRDFGRMKIVDAPDRVRTTLHDLQYMPEEDQRLFCVKTRHGTLEEVISQMGYMRRVLGARVICVDYLQAIERPGTDARAAIDHVLGRLKVAAYQLGVVLILASQLRRPGAAQADREPTKFDLKESSTIEQKAEVVLLLWRGATSRDLISVKIDKAKFARCPIRFHLRQDPIHYGLTTEDGDGWESFSAEGRGF